jgi:hypothetical protein
MSGTVKWSAVAMLGVSLLGVEFAAGAGLARGAKEWMGGRDALAIGRAGSIAATALAETAGNQARALVFDATLRAVRGVSAVYTALQGPGACRASSSCPLSVHARVHVARDGVHARIARSGTS